MLNINQNFDLKAPVFNFDRDYFNSVEELNAYDTSNVPDHFVTNVAGMLYLFTDGKWLPMIGTIVAPGSQKSYSVNLSNNNCYIFNDPENNKSIFTIGDISYAQIDTNGCILLTDERDGEFPYIDITKTPIDVYKNIRIGLNTEEFGLTITDDTTGDIQILTNKELTEEEQDDGYSPVNISLTDGDNKATINTSDGFRHSDITGCYSNLYSAGMDICNGIYNVSVYSNYISMYNDAVDGGGINLCTENDISNGSPINMSLTDGDYKATIDAKNGFTHTEDDGFVAQMNGYGVTVLSDGGWKNCIDEGGMSIVDNGKSRIYVGIDTKDSCIHIGDDEKFKISRPADNTEGATITGVESIKAFSDPSNTKVFATDGSIVDLSTKANTSDVLLKKSASGGYYIGDSGDYVGYKAFSIGGNSADGSNSFASGYDTKAYGSYSHVEGYYTEARGASAHAEGDSTYAYGNGSHSEGKYTRAKGSYSHAEGHNTYANCYAAHALGAYNIIAENVIHSVGIGNTTTRKNAEYIYAKNNESGTDLTDDPKNGYKYLIGVGGYDGISTDNTTYKSVQEVIADLTARIEQLETKVRALEAANTPA